MSLRFHWFLPANGDGRDIVGGGRGQIARGAERPETRDREPAAAS